MRNLVMQSGSFFDRMTTQTRIALGAALVVLVAAAAGLAYALRDGGTPLFARSLSAAQQVEVQQRLTAWDVPFHVSSDNIVIDPSRKHDLLLRLALVGVPHAPLTTSADVLKSVSALTPQTVLDAQVREGLEGDLAEGLRGISGVSDARVLIAPATRGFFVDEPSHDASASVRLTLDPVATLLPAAVSGIALYVASAVPGLSADHVSIMDQNGVALGTHASATDGGDEDRSLEATLQSALDRTIGAGKTIVVARREIDAAATTLHEVKRTPIAVAPLATDSIRERYHGKDKQYEKIHETTDRGSDTVERSTRFEPGRIHRRSVAVFVDRSQSALIPQIRDTIAAAAGILASRGDTLAVVPLQFSAPPLAPSVIAAKSPFAFASLGGSLPLVVMLVALAGAGTLLVRSLGPLVRVPALPAAATDTATSVADFPFEPLRIHAALAGEPPHAAAAILAALPSPTTAAVLEMYEPAERREIVRRLTNPLAPVVREIGTRVGGG